MNRKTQQILSCILYYYVQIQAILLKSILNRNVQNVQYQKTSTKEVFHIKKKSIQSFVFSICYRISCISVSCSSGILDSCNSPSWTKRYNLCFHLYNYLPSFGIFHKILRNRYSCILDFSCIHLAFSRRRSVHRDRHICFCIRHKQLCNLSTSSWDWPDIRPF